MDSIGDSIGAAKIAYEEAHSYLGKNGGIYARDSVERIFKEGRKFGVGAMVISQRPSELSETILAQDCSPYAIT